MATVMSPLLFRDHADYGEHTEALLGQLPKMLNESLSQIASFYKSMKKAGFRKIKEADIEPLAANVVLVLR